MELAQALPLARRDEAWLDPSLFPFRRRTLELEGARVSLADAGRGAPVLLLHGSPLWSFTWREPMRRLGHLGELLAMDLPGLGLSEAPPSATPYARNARVIRALMNELDLRDVVVVAHATAGPSALHVAARERRRLRGLVICNTFGWRLAGTPLGPMMRIVSSAPFRAINTHLNFLPRVTARVCRRTSALTPAERAAVLGPFGDRAARRHLSAMLLGLRTEGDFFDEVERGLERLADVPTLLLFGAHDNGAKAGHPERFARSLRRARVHRLPESAHFPTEDEPEAFTDALGDFLHRLR